MKKVRISQASMSVYSCTELFKTVFPCAYRSDYKFRRNKQPRVQVDKGLQTIQADVGIFTHIRAYSVTFRHSGIFGENQAYSKPYVTLVYSKLETHSGP